MDRDLAREVAERQMTKANKFCLEYEARFRKNRKRSMQWPDIIEMCEAYSLDSEEKCRKLEDALKKVSTVAAEEFYGHDPAKMGDRICESLDEFVFEVLSGKG